MDELLIEEKKYVSSKQAAKMTGYAKDYIGQLCREGRVPARLVGRSWYVLESAIQDHRFGNPEPEIAPEVKNDKPALPETWEPSRYEAATEAESFPMVNRLRDTEEDTKEDIETVEEPVTGEENASWQSWFDRFEHAQTGEEERKSTATAVDAHEDKEEEKEPEVQKEIEEEEVQIPIRTIYHPVQQVPVEDIIRATEPDPREDAVEEEKRPARMGKGLQLAGALIAIVFAALAVIGSGYIDEYIISSNQAQIFSGAVLYIK